MDDDQQFCLRWNNHQSTLVAVFDTLLENGTLVDCTLAAEGKFLNAHKVVLSACSPYFEALLSRHYDKHPILILKDVKFQELKAMMDYMYRGEVNISQDQLGALLKAAESLQIKGLSDNKKDEPPKKNVPSAAAAAPPKSPPPQPVPKVQGLTIEQRSRDDSREGSVSPGPRKKKRMRRKSEDEGHDASNSSESHSLPPQNIPAAAAQKMLSQDVADQVETKQEVLRHKEESQPHSNQTGAVSQTVPMIKEKLETHSELMLEPKSEYVEEMNEDSIEDLTLDDDDLSNMDQMDDGSTAGPSHAGEGSSQQQGFSTWHMGNQSQDEVFLAAQEAVGAHRDSQEFLEFDKIYVPPPLDNLLKGAGKFKTGKNENGHMRKFKLIPDDVMKPGYSHDSQFACRHCGKRYRWKSTMRRHEQVECGGKEPMFQCQFCPYRAKQKGNLGVHIRKHHSQQADSQSSNDRITLSDLSKTETASKNNNNNNNNNNQV